MNHQIVPRGNNRHRDIPDLHGKEEVEDEKIHHHQIEHYECLHKAAEGTRSRVTQGVMIRWRVWALDTRKNKGSLKQNIESTDKYLTNFTVRS